MGNTGLLRNRRRLCGAAAVELALLVVPLVLMTLATIEFARIVFTYNQLVKVTRDGARYLSGFDPSDGLYPKEIARARVLKPDDTNIVVSGLTLEMIEVCDRLVSTACTGDFANVATALGSMNLVRVQITGYTYQPIFPMSGLFGPITFEPIGTTMRQVL